MLVEEGCAGRRGEGAAPEVKGASLGREDAGVLGEGVESGWADRFTGGAGVGGLLRKTLGINLRAA